MTRDAIEQPGGIAEEQHSTPKIFASIELSKSTWVVGIRLPSQDKISIFNINGGEVDALLKLFDRARQADAQAGIEDAEIHSCYEAGRDGFWLHRVLEANGINNLVLDSASIQVSRRARHVKTDRIDAESLIRVLMALHRGETKVCSVVRVPTPKEEDAKRLHRSREKLVRDRVRQINRIKGLLSQQGIRHISPTRKDWTIALKHLRTRDGRPFPSLLMAEILREAKLLAVVDKMLADVDEQIAKRARMPRRRRRKFERFPLPIASQLLLFKGIGPTFATVLATEVFYRRFDNRRQVASYTGLTPTPYNSGIRQRDQGISKAGNPRARHYAVELAWLWLRHQPDSAITRWFHDRVGDAKGRVRRIALVAVARKLLVALWRFLDTGLIPDGAVMRPLKG